MIIKISKNIYLFISKALKYKFDFKILNRYSDYLIIKINNKDFDLFKQYFYFIEYEIIKYCGFKGLYNLIKNNALNILLLLYFLIGIFTISNFIVCIDINTNDVNLKNKVHYILETYNIKLFTKKFNLKELSDISDDILLKNRDLLEFISINRLGMKYVVNVEERIISNIPVEKKFCHFIADKNGVVKIVNANTGIALVEKGSLVHKGDILISGAISLNDEVKQNVCANGIVLTNTWYNVHVSVPYIEYKNNYTGLYKYNLSYNEKDIFKNHFSNYDKKVLFKIGLFKLIKQSEYEEDTIKLTYKEAYKKGISKAKNELLARINKNSYIIYEKVLKEIENNSTIELDIFLSVIEPIGYQQEYSVGGLSDTG